MKKYLVIISIIILATQLVFADSNTLTGVLHTKDNGNQPIVGATVRIQNTVLGTITDKKGEFRLQNLPKGTYKMIISAVGMESLVYEFEHTGQSNDELLRLQLAESAIQTKDIVVTATRSEKIYEDTPVKISVLSNEVFSSTSSVSLREGLNFQPGLRTETNCQNCGFSQVRINGMEGKYSQILINGRANFSALNGVYGLEQLPTNMIDRIEVVRGGGSSLYGGNAIAGVINIITKDPTYNFFNADFIQAFTDGNTPDNTLSLSGSIVNDKQNLGVFLYGMNRNRGEWDANGDGFTEIGRLDVKTFGGNIFYNPTYRSRVSADFSTIFHEIRGGDMLDFAPHFTNITEMATHKTNSAQVAYEQYINGKMTKISLYSAFQNTKRNSYYGADQDPNAYGSTDNETYTLGTQFTHLLASSFGYHILTLGYELNYDWMKDLAPAYDRTIDQLTRSHGFYIQDDWSINEKFSFILGSRFDNHNMIDGIIISPRANMLYKLTDNLSFRGSVSTGYRAPQAFDEDLHITQVGGEGLVIRVDEELEAEKSFSVSGSLDYSFKVLELPIALSLEFFSTKLNNVFILEDDGRDENDNLVLMRRNGESANVTGGTLELQFDISRNFDLISGLTYQKSVFNEDVEWSAGDDELDLAPQFSKYIFRTPDLYGYFVTNYRITPNLEIGISGIYTGSMHVPHYAGNLSQDILVRTKEFFELNMKASYRLKGTPSVQFSLGIYNILNSYQNDFGTGIERDAGYIYGPARPFTVYWSIKTEL